MKLISTKWLSSVKVRYHAHHRLKICDRAAVHSPIHNISDDTDHEYKNISSTGFRGEAVAVGAAPESEYEIPLQLLHVARTPHSVHSKGSDV